MRRAALIAFALALGLLVGRLSAPGGSSPPPPLPDSPGPTRELSGGVGVGYAHTRAGAVAAGANYQRALTALAMLRPAELRRRIEAVATPRFAPTMIAANEPGARRLREGLLGAGAERGIPTAYLGVPVAYRLVSYSPRRAVIRNWGFTLVGNEATVEPRAYFGLSEMELRWREGDWKIAHTEASYGPTPELLTPREGGEGFGVMNVLQEMGPYGIAP